MRLPLTELKTLIEDLRPTEDLIEPGEAGVPESLTIDRVLRALGIIIGVKGTSRIRIAEFDVEKKQQELERFEGAIEKIISELDSAENGTLSRQQVVAILAGFSLSDESYYHILGIMSLLGLATSAGRSRTGGFQKSHQEQDDGELEKAEKIIGEAPPKSKSEKENEHEEVLYPAAADFLSQLNYQAIILGRKRRLAGEWNTPDIAGYRVRTFHLCGVPDIQTVTIEVKWSISKQAIAEATSHQRFAHYSYLLVRQDINSISVDLREDLITQGLGLIALINKEYAIIIPPKYTGADLESVDDFLNAVLSEEERKGIHDEMANHIVDRYFKNKTFSITS